MLTRTYQQVKAFAEALTLALFDRKLELQGSPIIFYYDTDVVLNMVMGFELDLALDHRLSSDEQRVVRALLSCNHLGAVHMLRPHAFELVEKLRRQAPYLQTSGQELFAQRARNYLREKRIEEIMSQLRLATAEGSGSTEERIEKFLDILAKSAGSTFASIEMINGSWSQRFRRYYESGLLCLDHLGPEIDVLLAKDLPIVEELSHILKRLRPKYTFNDFKDAAALAILHKMITETDQGASNKLVRFYTETGPLYEACRIDTRVRSLLTYKKPVHNEIPAEAGLVVRNSAYLLMRAWFSELTPGARATPLTSLERFVSSLEDLLEVDKDDFEQAVSTLELEGRSLLELIETFNKLAIMDSIWVRGRIPDNLLVSEWTDVFAFAQGRATGERLFEKIEDIRGKLEEKLSRIRIWARDFDLIRRSSQARHERIAGVLEEPMRDLGLVRWGYDLTQPEKEELIDTVRALLQEEEPDHVIESSKLATRMEEARYDARRCMMMCAILWALGRLKEIVLLVQECRLNTEERVPPSLLVIQASAEIKSGPLSLEEKRQLVDQLWAMTSNLPYKERIGCLLGVGYVLYHAWRQENLGRWVLGRTRENTAELQEWARKSFLAGEEAVKLLPPAELAWAFAVNHCTYVGIVTGVEPERTENYFRELLKLQSFPAVWNNRFDDTIAFYYLSQIEREWEETPPDFRYKLKLSERIEMAEEYLARAIARDFGDIDLREHISRLQHLKMAYERVNKSVER